MDDDFQPLFSINITYPDASKSVDLGNKIKPKAVTSSPDLIARPISGDDSSLPTPTINSNTTYTLVLTDPDATSRAEPVKAEMCHWIVTGISFNASSVHHLLRLPVDLDTIVDAFQAHQSKSDIIGHDSSTLEGSKVHPCGESERCAVSGETSDCAGTPNELAGPGEPKELMSYFPPAPPPKTGYHRYVFVLLAPEPAKGDPESRSAPKKPSERPHWGYGKVGKGVRDWAKDNQLTPIGANFFYAKNKKQ